MKLLSLFIKSRFRNVAAAACGIACLFTTFGNATTVIPPTFEEMADRADLVFVGKAVNSRAEWRTGGTDRVIFTFVEFEVQELLKGNSGKTVTLQFLGGTVGDVTLEVSGIPRFNAGDRVVLFVEKNGVHFCPLVGMFHGKYGLHKDETTGRDMVLMYNGKPLRDVTEIGTGEGAEFAPKRAKVSIPADREPMPLDTFKSKIHGHLAEKTSNR